MSERWNEIRARAYATLERTAYVEEELSRSSNVIHISEDVVSKWRREADEHAERMAREKNEQTIRQAEQRLASQVSGLMSEALVDHKDLLLSIIEEALGQFSADIRAERERNIADLRSAIDLEIAALRSEIDKLRADASGIVTLPRRA